jgi:hypothetical protein
MSTGILDDQKNARVDNTKTLAARIAALAVGYSIREFLDALALTSGALIRNCFRGHGVDIATSNYLDALKRSLEKK